MKERYQHIIPKKEEIRQLQKAKAQGKYHALLPSLAEFTNNIRSDDLEYLCRGDIVREGSQYVRQKDIDLQKRLLAVAQITVGIFTDWAQATENAPLAYERWDAALHILTKFYQDPYFQRIGESVTEDVFGNQANYPLKIASGSAQLCFAGEEITGNPEFFRIGIAYLDYAIDMSKRQSLDPEMKPILQLEKMKAKIRRGDPIDEEQQQEQKSVLLECGFDFTKNPLQFEQLISGYVTKRQKLIEKRTSETWKKSLDTVSQPFKENIQRSLRRIGGPVVSYR